MNITGKLTDQLFNSDILKRNIERLRTCNPEDIAQVLERLEGKGVRFSKLMDEEQLSQFLSVRGIAIEELVEDSRETRRLNEGVEGALGQDMSYLHTWITYKPIDNLRIIKNIENYDRDWKPPIDNKPLYAISEYGVTVQDFQRISNVELILESLRGCALLYSTQTSKSHKYMSLRSDLSSLIESLVGLKDFKWPMILFPEIRYFRKRTAEEIRHLRKLEGEKADEILRKEDLEREKIQKEYDEFKKNPEHPVKIITFWDRETKEVLCKITIEEYLSEKGADFSNWKRNKHVESREGQKLEYDLIPQNKFSQDRISQMIQGCKDKFEKKPSHWLDTERGFIERNKKTYQEKIEADRKKYADVVRKYDYLIPALKVINSDIFDGWKI